MRNVNKVNVTQSIGSIKNYNDNNKIIIYETVIRYKWKKCVKL